MGSGRLRALILGLQGRWRIENVQMDKNVQYLVIGADGRSICILPPDYPHYSMGAKNIFGNTEESIVFARDGTMEPMIVGNPEISNIKLDPDLFDRTVRSGYLTAHFKLNREKKMDLKKYLPYILMALGGLFFIIVILKVTGAG